MDRHYISHLKVEERHNSAAIITDKSKEDIILDNYDILLNALIVGAAGRTDSSTHPSVNEAYLELKEMLDEEYPGVKLKNLEESPGTKGFQGLIKEDLINAGAGNDVELIEKAKQFLTTAILSKSESDMDFKPMDD